MSSLSDVEKKSETHHIEQIKTNGSTFPSENIDDLDSIEQTQSGKFAWLVSITAGVGGLLFGWYSLTFCHF